jgi:hypothetical protein
VRNKNYTKEQLDFLRTGYMSMNVNDLTVSFNRQFGTSKSETAIKSTLKNHKIKCGRKPADQIRTRNRKYTDEQEQFIREHCVKMRKRDVLKLFNDHFGTDLTLGKLKALMGNRRINTGRTGYFPKGHIPWNSGTKGQGLTGPNSTSFQKGQIPPNRKPLYTERINKDGHIEIKIPEENPYTGRPTSYKHKHVWLWEQENGPVPKGHAVSFIDGDKLNCVLSNLMLLTRAELLHLNRNGYKDAPAELKPTILAMVRLKLKTRAMMREKGKKP